MIKYCLSQEELSRASHLLNSDTREPQEMIDLFQSYFNKAFKEGFQLGSKGKIEEIIETNPEYTNE